MSTTSSEFLINGLSFVTKTDGDTATVVRTATGSPITQQEKDDAGSYYDSATDTIDYAKIFNLDFGPNFLDKLGGSDEWMGKALTDKVYKDAFKKATGKTGPNLSFAAINEANKNFESSPVNSDANGQSNSRRSTNLRYPLNESHAVKYDYMQVTAYKHEANTFNTSSIGSGFADADERIGVSLGKVFLPMQPEGLADGNGVDWQNGTAGALEVAAFKAAQAGVSAATKEGNIIANVAKATMETGIKEGEALLKNSGISNNDIASFFASRAVGNNSLFTRATGKVLNPNLELLFNGPRLREFNYNFRFTPREEREAREIRRIIKFFKKNMAPQRVASKLFLKTPNVFKLKYIFKGGRQHPFLNKIKMCALTQFNVTYAPDGSYMTYDDGSMTAYNVSMSFGELNPIYENDYDDDSNDMGF
jgi:hypothetical protein